MCQTKPIIQDAVDDSVFGTAGQIGMAFSLVNITFCALVMCIVQYVAICDKIIVYIYNNLFHLSNQLSYIYYPHYYYCTVDYCLI